MRLSCVWTARASGWGKAAIRPWARRWGSGAVKINDFVADGRAVLGRELSNRF